MGEDVLGNHVPVDVNPLPIDVILDPDPGEKLMQIPADPDPQPCEPETFASKAFLL